MSCMYSTGSRGSNEYSCPGLLLHDNTLGRFKLCDRKAMLQTLADQRLWQHIVSGRAIDEPAILASFILHIHAVSFIIALRTAIHPD